MALDIELVIKADASQAKRELASVEQSIKKVETSATATGDPLKKVTSGLDNVAASSKKVEQSVKDQVNAFQKQIDAQIAAEDASHKLSLEQATLQGRFASVAATMGVSTATLGTLTVGLGAAAVASTALAAVIAQSTRHYFQHAEAMRDSREALSDLSEGWNSFQMIVGAAVVGDQFSIAKPIDALNAGLVLTGVMLAQRIDETRTWAELLARTGMFGDAGRFLANTFTSNGQRFDRAQRPLPWADPGGLLNNPVPPHIAARMRDEQKGIAEGYGSVIFDDDYIKKLDEKNKKAAAEAARLRAFYGGLNPGWVPGMSSSMMGSYFSPVGVPNNFYSPGVINGLSGMPGSAEYSAFYGPGVLNGMTGFAPGRMLPTFNTTLPGTQVAVPGFGGGFLNSAFGGSAAFGNSLASIVLQSMTGGGSMIGGIGSFIGGGIGSSVAGALTGGAGIAIGGLAGGALNAILPGVGALLGPALSGLLGKAFGPTDYELRVRQLDKDRASAHDLLSTPGLGRQWDAMGGNVPFNFAFLQTQAQNDPTRVAGYLDAMLEKHERLNAAMQKYGISWEELGDKAQQSHIDQMAEDLILDFDVLTQAGANVDFVIEKMGTSINEFVESALRTGSEVPSAMRPMIERMEEMGLLTSELEDITWAETMTQGFDRIVEAINRVAQGLGVTIPDAIDQIPKDVDINLNLKRNTQDNFTDGSDPFSGGPAVAHQGGYLPGYGRLQSFHDGGFPIWVQSGEFVMSRSAVARHGVAQMHAWNKGQGGGGVTVNITGSYVDSERTARSLAERVSKVLVRG